MLRPSMGVSAVSAVDDGLLGQYRDTPMAKVERRLAIFGSHDGLP